MKVESMFRWMCAAVVILGSGGCCEKVAEKAAEKAAEKVVEEATGGDASVVFGSNVDLSDLPVAFRYPGATAKGRFAKSGGTGEATVYILESGDPPAKVQAHYAGISGYKQMMKMDTPDGSIYGFESRGETFNITVAASGSKTGSKTGITVVHTKSKP